MNKLLFTVLIVLLSGCLGISYVERNGEEVRIGYHATRTPWGVVQQAAKDECGSDVRFIETIVPTAAVFHCER